MHLGAALLCAFRSPSSALCLDVCGSSVEKDGSPLSDEKQTIQTSLFALLKDFLKSPSPEELHCVLAYVLSVGEERQVTSLLSPDLLFSAVAHPSLSALSRDSLLVISFFFFFWAAFRKRSLPAAYLSLSLAPPRWPRPWTSCTSC